MMIELGKIQTLAFDIIHCRLTSRKGDSLRSMQKIQPASNQPSHQPILSPLRHAPIKQKLPFLTIPLPFNNLHNRPRAIRNRLRPPLPRRHRIQIRLREPRAKHKSPDPQLPILPHLAHGKHIQRRLRSAVLDERRVVNHSALIETTTDCASARRDVDDARTERIG